jgi:autotransporter strand-loop-strand O-heptosyltransferase
MFIQQYPNVTFVSPGTPVENLYAMYCVGLFYNDDSSINLMKNPIDPKTQTMQKMCSDILGLDFIEVRTKIKKRNIKIDPNLKQVCIGIFGTAQSKFWNNPTGWQDVVDFLKDKGYEVRLLSKEEDGYMGNKNPKGVTLQPRGTTKEVLKTIQESKLFIGISSGLSWLAFAIGTHVVLISNFTASDYEFTTKCTRIVNTKVCHDCWSEHKLDASQWGWCPRNQNFVCHTSITAEMVIAQMQKLL